MNAPVTNQPPRPKNIFFVYLGFACLIWIVAGIICGVLIAQNKTGIFATIVHTIVDRNSAIKFPGGS